MSATSPGEFVDGLTLAEYTGCMVRRLAALLIGATLFVGCRSEVAPVDVRVAVAANFAACCSALVERFEAASPWTVQISSASTGVHCAQIVQGAPYDVFLAADAERPERLEDAGLIARGSRFVYAIGRLALVTRTNEACDEAGLRESLFERFAIADPALAPYGVAAEEVLDRVGGERSVTARAKNVLGALHYVRSGNADAGLVALASVVRDGSPHWPVPPEWHQPIRQEAVMLETAANPEAAESWLKFLRSVEAAEILRDYGYAVPSG